VEKKNNGIRVNLKTVGLILGLVISILAIFSYYNSSIESKIANHPKIIKMENGIQNTDKQIQEIKVQLDKMDKKLDDIKRNR
jgi:peptidoglycan hydrolase CwlO-like protein